MCHDLCYSKLFKSNLSMCIGGEESVEYLYLNHVCVFIAEMYGNDKGVPATFRIMYFIGWKPDKSQVHDSVFT